MDARALLHVYRAALRETLGRGGMTLVNMKQALDDYGAGVLDAPDEAVKVWSDLHLGHANIIGYTGRPFAGAAGRSKILVMGNHDLGRRSGRRVAHGYHRYEALLSAPGDPPLIFTHLPLPNVPEGHVCVRGHQHQHLRAPDSPSINVSVERLDYRPIGLAQVRRLARAIVAGEGPEGATTMERVAMVATKPA